MLPVSLDLHPLLALRNCATLARGVRGSKDKQWEVAVRLGGWGLDLGSHLQDVSGFQVRGSGFRTQCLTLLKNRLRNTTALTRFADLFWCFSA